MQAALTKADTELIKETTERAAYVESLTEFCNARQPGNEGNNGRALDEWKSRNYWTVLAPRLSAQPAFDPAFAQLKTHYMGNLTNGGQKMLQLCGYVPKLLRYPNFDPSTTRATELSRIAATVSQTPAAAPPAAPPIVENAPTTPQPMASGADVVAGAATLQMPAGWRVTKTAPGSVVMQKQAKYGGLSIIYAGLKPAAGDVAQGLRESLHGEFSQIQFKNFQSGRTRTGVRVAYARDYGPIGGKKSAQVAAVAFALPNGLQVAELLSTASVGDYIDHRKEFEGMVEHFRLAGAPATPTWDPLRPPAGSGGIAAVYLGSTVRNELNPLGGMDLKAIREYLVLLKNGQAYRDIPDDGHVTDMNFADALSKHPQKCGTYKVEGDKIAFTWIDDYGFIKDDAVPFHRGGSSRGSVDLGSMTVSEVPAAHSLKISGRYTSTFYMSGNTAMSSTGITAQTFISFAPDGTYQKSGFSSATFSNSAGGSTTGGTVNSRKGVESGHYTIDGYTLTLTPASGGGPDLYTIIFEEISTSPKAVFINDKAFLR